MFHVMKYRMPAGLRMSLLQPKFIGLIKGQYKNKANNTVTYTKGLMYGLNKADLTQVLCDYMPLCIACLDATV